MRIGMVTTWGSRCGIATYSEQLCRALRDHGVTPVPLVPDDEHRQRHVDGFEPAVCWNLEDMAGTNAAFLCGAVSELRLDAVHIQHEFGLHRSQLGFLRIVRDLSKIPVFVTLHTVPPSMHYSGMSGWLSLLRRHAVILCHTPAGTASVLAASGPRRAITMPHGTPSPPPPDIVNGLRILGLDQKPSSIGVSPGFIGLGKNIYGTVLAFGECMSRGALPDDAMFVICGDSSRDGGCISQILRPAIESVAPRNVNLVDRYLDDSEMADVLAAADYAVLNTQSHALSSSGQLHLLAAHGVPTAVASRPIYSDGIAAGAVPFHVYDSSNGRLPEEPSPGLIAAIAALAGSETLRKSVSVNMLSFAKRTSWERVAGMHVGLYKEEVG